MSNVTILCVDDERNVLLTLRAQLLRHFPDCTIEIAESGAEALALAEELLAAGAEVPLVIADQIMPTMKGNELLIELHARYPRMLQIMLTGQASAEDVGSVANRGNLYRFIAKPWNEVDLQLTVTEAMRRYQQEQQLYQQQAALEQANQDLEILNAELEQQIQERTQQLRQNEQQLRLFVEHTPAAIAMFDREMRYLLTSRRWKIDYELGDQEIIGRSHYEVFPDIPERWRAAHQRCLAGAIERCEEDRWVKQDGSVRWNQWEIHPWYADTGEIGGIILFTQVVTKRKQTELALRESEEKFHLLANHLRDAFFICTPTLDHYFYVSPAVEQIWALSPAQFYRNPRCWLERVHPEDWNYFLANTPLDGITTDYDLEYRLLHPDGEVRWVHIRSYPVTNDQGQVDRVVGVCEDITDRKIVELSLQESETRLRLALEVSKAIAWERDLRTNQIFFSSTTTSPNFQSISYEDSLTLVHPEDRENLHRANQTAIAQRGGFWIEHRVIAPGQDPEWQWFQVSARTLTDDAGNPTRIIGMSLDITEQKQAEAALRQSEERFREIARTVSQLFFIRSATTGEFIYVSPAYEVMWGRSRESLYQHPQSWIESVHPDDRALVIRSLAEQFSRDSVQREYRIIQPNGEIRWISAQINLVRDEAGEPARFVGIAVDVTDRKLVEIALRESERRYATLAEALPVGVFRHDANGSMIYANERWREITGLSHAEGIEAGWLKAVHPDWYDRAIENWQQVDNHSKRSIETCLLHPDHSIRWVYCQTIPEYNEAGETIGYVGTLTDITQLKQVEASLLEAQRLAHIGNWSFDLTTQEITWSEELYHMFGMDPSQPVPPYAEYLEKIHPEDQPRLMQCVEQASRDGRPYILDYRAIHTDGSIRYHEGRGEAIRNAQGQVVKLYGAALDITDRKQAEAKIQQSEEQLQLTLAFTGIGVWSWQPVTGEYYWNGQMEQLLELPSGLDNMFQVWHDNIHPDDVERINSSLQDALATGSTFAEEYRYRLSDGRMVWRWVKGQAVYTETGDVERVLGVVQDIDDRKSAEIKLQQTTEDLDRFFSVALDLLCIANTDGYFLRLNPSWERTLGYSLNELENRKFLDFVHPDDLESTLDAIAVLSGQQEVLNFVNRYRHQDGSYRWIEWRSIPVGQMIYAAARDVTERKQAEIALQESERFLSMALSAAQAGVWEWDRVQNQAYWSDENFRLLGYEPGSVEPSYDHWLQAVHPDDREQASGQISRALTDKDELNLEYRVLLPNGAVRWLIDRGRVIEDDQGNPIAMHGIQIDITDRKRAETQLAAQNVLLEQVAKGEPLSNILTEFIEQIEQQLQGAYCSIMFLEADNRLHHGAAQSLPEAYVEAVDGVWVGEGRGSCGTAAFRNQPVIVSDIATDPLWANYRELALSHGLQACWSIPIQASDGHVLGTFAVYYAEIRSPQSDELETVLQMANIVGIAIEREQAEVILRDSEHRYVTLMAVAPVGIFRFDAAGECVYVNQRWSEMTGRPAETALGQGWIQAVHPEDRAAIVGTWLQSFQQTGGVHQMEGRHLRPDGTINWFYVQVLPETNAEGALIGYVGALTDITELKQVEDSLRQSEAKQRALISALPDLLLWVSRDGIYLDFFSTSSFKVLGNRDTVIGTHVVDSLPSELAQRRMNAIHAALETGELQIYEQELWVDGALQTEECRVVVCGDHEVLVIGRDITDRKRAEAALQESEERRRLALDLTGTGSWEFEVATGEAIWSDTHYQLMGLTPGEQPSNYQVWRERVHPEDLEWVEQAFTQALDTHSLLDVEYRVIHPDGQIYWMLTKGQGIYNESGQPIRMVGVMIDVSIRKQAEVALKLSQERLETLINALPFAVWVRDANDRIVLQNSIDIARYGNQLGIHVEELIDASILVEEYKRIKANCAIGEFFTSETVERVNDQDRFFLRIAAPLPDIYGNRGMFGVAIDITDRKQAEQALSQLNDELELRVQQRTQELRLQTQLLQSERLRLQLALEAADMGTWEINLQGGIWSERIETILGYPPGTFSGTQEAILARIHPDDREKVLQALTDSFANQSPCNIDCRINQLQGGMRWVSIRGKAVPNEEGVGLRIVGVALDITERKQAEEAIRLSQEQLQLALEGSGDGLWDWNVLTGEAYLSPRWLGILGYEKDELPGYVDSWERLIHPDDRADLTAVLNAHLKDSSVPYQVEYRARTKTGQWIWIANYGKVVARDADGKPLRMVGLQRDITDRKQAQESLLSERLRLQLALEAANMATWSCSLQTGELNWSDHAQEIFGFVPGTFPGDRETFLSMVHAEDIDRVVQAVAHTFETGAPYNIEYRIRRLDGQIRWVAVWGIVPQNLPTSDRQMIGVVCDITDRKQAEVALRDSEELFRTTFEQAAVGIIQTNLKGQLVQMNQKFCDIVGYSESELFLKYFGEITYPDDLAPDEANVRRLLSGTVSNFVMEKRYIRSTGEIVWVNLSVSLMRSSSGEPQCFIGVIQDISDRKQAEQDLQESRNMLKLVLDTIPQRVFWKDRQSVFLGCNSAFANDYQLRLEDIVGKTDSELPWAEWAHLYQLDDAAVIHSRTPKLNYEEPTVNLNGEQIWIRSSKIPLTNSQGEIIGILGCYDDITDRKLAEEALRNSEERLRLALTTANQGLYDLNLKTGKAIVSPEYATMLGYDPATFQETNTKWIERLHPDDREPVAATYRAYIAGEIPNYQVEFRQRTQDGHWKWILSLGKIVAWDEAGQPLRMIGTHTDLDDRKQAEAQLQDQEQFLRSIFENVENPIFVIDVLEDGDFRFVGWNPASERISNIPAANVIGKSVIEAMGTEVGSILYSNYRRCVDQDISLTYEEFLTLPSGNIWSLTTLNPLKDLDGQIYRIVGTALNITDRKQAEETLQQFNQELEQRVTDRTIELQQAMEAAETANHAKSRFLANMSHELRTPLNAILGFSQLLNRDAGLNLDQQEKVGVINRSGEHLLNLINDILAMSKIESGRITLTMKSFDLQSLLKDLEELFGLKAESKGLTLTTQIDSAVPQYIQTDESKLRQILINLLGNAIKFTSGGGITLRVQSREPESFQVPSSLPLILHFEVEDTGCGIDPAEQTIVFEPFGQTQAGQALQEGTGLGLPISRQFVELMGGELSFTSIPNQGSTFYFTIPVDFVQADKVLPQSPPQRVMGLAADQPDYRLLVVEDNQENRQFLMQLLRSVGFEVESATNGLEAVSLWQSWSPHLIWMDMRMPVMDGYAATQRIRELERSKFAASEPQADNNLFKSSSAALESQSGETVQTTTKILALTASAFEDERSAILAAGCDDFVFKPATEAVLFEKISEHLGVQYLYQEQAATQVPKVSAMADELLTARALQVMPQHWIDQVQRAARIADEDLILELIDQIPDSQSGLAEGLKALVGELQLDKLIELTSDQDL